MPSATFWQPNAALRSSGRERKKEMDNSDRATFTYHGGQAFNVSVVNPLNTSVVSRAAKEQGVAAAEAAKRKCTKYAPYVAANNVSFNPFIMETFGGLGTEAVMFIKRLATQAARHRGTAYKTEKNHPFQKLSLTLQRGIASMLISRMVEPI